MMPRLTSKNPISFETPRGHAGVASDGHEFYLGPHGTKPSRAEYDRLIGEWLANGRSVRGAGGPSDYSVGGIIAKVLGARALKMTPDAFCFSPGESEAERLR